MTQQLLQSIGSVADAGTGSGVATGTATATVATPIFTPAPTTYSTPQLIIMSTTTTGATIYYTTDGSTPTTASSVFIGSFHIWGVAGKTIKTYAVKAGMVDSPVATGMFSYIPLKTGQLTSYAAGDDGNLQSGVAISYSAPTSTIYPSDYTTTDNSTGFVWKTCSEGLSGPTCTGVISSGGIASAFTACNALNTSNAGSGFAGKTNWRLPTMKEILTLNDASIASNPIDLTAFPGNMNFAYWAQTPYPANTGFGWYLDYTNGNAYATTNTNLYHTRCVAAAAPNETRSFVDFGDGTVKDNTTGLTWQKCTGGQNNDATCSGTAMVYPWTTALTTCSGLALGGKTWRLPNRSELQTLMDYTKAAGPTIDQISFPNTIAAAIGDYYWTSTTVAGNTAQAWYVNFTTIFNSLTDVSVKTTNYYVRCVAN